MGTRVRATTPASSCRDGCSAAGLVLAVLFKLPKDVRTHHKAARELAREEKAAEDPHEGIRLKDFLYVPAVPYLRHGGAFGRAPRHQRLAAADRGRFPWHSGRVPVLHAVRLGRAGVRSRLAGRLCDTQGFDAVIVPVLLVELAGVAALVCMDSLFLAAVAGVLVGVGQGSAYSALQAEAVRGANVEELGRASNTFYIGPDINMGMSPVRGRLRHADRRRHRHVCCVLRAGVLYASPVPGHEKAGRSCIERVLTAG